MEFRVVIVERGGTRALDWTLGYLPQGSSILTHKGRDYEVVATERDPDSGWPGDGWIYVIDPATVEKP